MHVSTIMTGDPVTVTESTTLDEALARMDDHDIRHLPVMRYGELVGVLSDRDLLEATAGLPSRVHATRRHEGGLPKNVGDIMHEKVVLVEPEDTIAAASVDFLSFGIGCLPVVKAGALVGILTELDLVKAFVHGLIDPPGSKSKYLLVGDQMTKSPTTIGWSTSLSEATAICSANGIRHLIVEENDRVVGIVSDRDLRRAVGAGRHANATVDDVLSRDVVTTTPDTPLVEAANELVQRKISCLPVLDDERLVGILTVADILDHCLDACQERHESAQSMEPRGSTARSNPS
jgi:CBS domain-containing protein